MKGRALGVDLGASNARAAVVDRETGEVVSAHKESLRDRTPAAVVEVVAHAVREATGGVDPKTFGGLGVGLAGQCLGTTGQVLVAPNLGWRDVPFGPMLSRVLGIPVRVANDLSAAAWGEQQFGAAKGFADVLLVFVGSGIGSGLILGGRLYEGSGGLAGELGHIKVRPLRPETQERRCGCGGTSCLESYCSGMNIAAWVRDELSKGASSLVRDLVEGDMARVNASVIDTAYGEGDVYARGLWNEVGELLGTGIANVVTELNPSRVILGGGVLLGCPHLASLVRQFFDLKVSPSALTNLSFENAFLGDDAGVIGAALLQGA